MKKYILIMVLAFSALRSQAQNFNPQLATMLQDTLNTFVSMISNIKGMSASVYIPGQGLWQGTSGLSYGANILDKDMKFGIASNTKLFVATIMLKLQEDGILSLNDSVGKWLPNYKNVNSKITLRQLLNHTSGVSECIFLPPYQDTIMAHPTRVFTPTEVLSWLGAAKFAPGKGWYYSNVNYVLAGMVAKAATGIHISKLIRDSILTPLNLNNTFYDVEEAEIGTIAHRWFNNVDYSDTSRVGLNTAGGCAGALFSNSADMATWYSSLFSGKIINSNSLKMLTTFVSTGSAGYDYAFGLDRSITQGVTYWGHGGSTWGYKSKLIYDSCMGTVVCGLANSWPAGMDGVTFLLYRVVLNHVPKCAGMLTGSDTVCQSAYAIKYTVPPIAGATSYTWTLPAGFTGSSDSNSIFVDFAYNAVSGAIQVSGVNNFGAGGNASIWVNVKPKPIAPYVTQNQNVLNSSIATGNQWYNSQGKLVGETHQTLNITKSDNYYCTVSVNGCTSDTSNNVQAQFIGLDGMNLDSYMQVYPNPVGTELTLALPGNTEVMRYEVCNSFGQAILQGDVRNFKVLNMETVSAGFYTLRVYNGQSITVKKLIKE